MSATTELLSEKLRELENLLSETSERTPEELENLKKEREVVLSRLHQANEGLNEGTRRLLKG